MILIPLHDLGVLHICKEPVQLLTIPLAHFAGHRASSFTQKDLTPLLPSTAKPVPRPQHGADAWLSRTSTAQMHADATPGRRSADHEHSFAGTQQHSAAGWLGPASIVQMSLGATPEGGRAADHHQSSAGTTAWLRCSDSNFIPGKHADMWLYMQVPQHVSYQ